MGSEQMIISERTRKLASTPFQENVPATVQLPRDTVLKHINMRLSGSVTTTFASGTPVAYAWESTFSSIVKRVEIVVNGNRTVKSLSPIFLRMQQFMFNSILGERRSSAGASAVINPTVDQGFVYGTTTQLTSVVEGLILSFECVPAKQGKETTWLNLKNVASAELRFTFGAFSSLLGFGNTAPVIYSANTMQIDITTVEQQDVPYNIRFADFRQTQKQEAFSSETSERKVEINRGNFLIGLMFLAREGQAGTATTATGKLPSNNLVSKMELIVNGMQSIKSTTFQELQAENRAKLGINAPMASNVSLLDGFAYLDLLGGERDLSKPLDVRPPMVDILQLSVSTRAASYTGGTTDYTNPATLDILTNEYVLPN